MVLLTANLNSMMDMIVISFFITMMGQIEMLKIDFNKLTDIIDNNNLNKSGNQTISLYSERNNSSYFYHENMIKIYERRIIDYVKRYKAILT